MTADRYDWRISICCGIPWLPGYTHPAYHVSHGQPKRHGPHQSIRSISIRMINAHECTLVSAHDAQKENGVWTVDRLQYAVPCTAFANTVLYRASVREHLSWDVGGREAGHARRERLTLHRRARRVEGTCATSEQRARSALSAHHWQPNVRRRGGDMGCGDGQQPVAVGVGPFRRQQPHEWW